MTPEPRRQPGVFSLQNITYDQYFKEVPTTQAVLELCFHFRDIPTNHGLFFIVQAQLAPAVVTLFGAEGILIDTTPPYVINYVLCNVILTEGLQCPEAEHRVIAALERMDPPARDVQIVRAYDVVPRCNRLEPPPQSLAEMPAFAPVPEGYKTARKK